MPTSLEQAEYTRCNTRLQVKHNGNTLIRTVYAQTCREYNLTILEQQQNLFGRFQLILRYILFVTSAVPCLESFDVGLR